jgi:hypothetical protein
MAFRTGENGKKTQRRSEWHLMWKRCETEKSEMENNFFRLFAEQYDRRMSNYG